MLEMIVVKAIHDMDAGVWLVETSDIPGLNLEGDTLEQLAEKLPGAIRDLRETNGDAGGKLDVPIKLVAQASSLAGELSKKPV
ncbi:DUF1902 domain-containing protein [Spiribacter aquaticus]|uniref:DUF1902 domain-containing protein n=1 Tax=Spiribacter aquaticus TaxID=1935996 RepID=A0A557RGL4_9GAMM|nr:MULTISPECIES: DUF1902 domain-containing protein [Spiribacter]KAF0280942.1 hypothetical protein BA897_09930 [Spiribacter roseus]TVO64300.1 DUF1902 domain-containing protein [Spiribacter aquaticus]